MFANAYVIEGRSGTVVVDALLTRPGSRDLRARVDALGKPLLAIVLTHGHPDHYGGIAQLVEGQNEVPVIAMAGVDRIVRRDDAMKGERLNAFGIDWSPRRVFPSVVMSTTARLTFDDFALTPIDVGEAESHHDSVWVLHAADGEHAFVGDLVMNGVHAYTADGHTGAWLAALDRVAARFTRIYPGHGAPGGQELVAAQRGYLERFRAEVQDLAAGRPDLGEDQARELERRMVAFLAHDRLSRWAIEGASPVAVELAREAGAPRRGE
jgi:glyoxylase-like metal-dependent hydrolase (beta-lactamase superfamily II)